MLDSETTEEISKIECMRGTASASSVSSLTSDLHSDLYPHMDKPGLSSLYRTSRHYGPRSENEFSVSDASDSGICMNNSKLDSVSDHDEYERPGVFDYIQGCRASSMEPQIDIVTVKNLSEYNERFSPHPSTAATNKANLKHGHITVHNSRLLESSNSDNEVSPESPRSEDSGSAFEESNSRMKFNREIEMVQLRKRSESPDPETQSLLHPDAMKCQRKDARKHNNQVYDEAFPVEERSVSSGSQESSTSSGEELQQVVVKNPDSDVDLSYVNVHSRLYDGRDAHFSSTARDFSEEYLDDDLEDDDPGRALQRLSDSITNGSSNSYEREVNFRSTQHYGAARTYGSFGRDREPVDRRVNFGLGGSTSSLSSGVRVEKSVSSKMKQPPFGDPVKLERVGHSNSRLLQGTNMMRSMETKNMPDAEIIKPEGKRKKKRKKKEESEEKSDINGNPLEEGRARSLSEQVEPYNKSESSYYKESRFPSSTGSFDGSYVLNNNDMMPSVDQQKFHEKKARKIKKKEQEVKGVIKAEKIPGHRGDDDVDALLNFIVGDKGGNPHSNLKHQVQKNHLQRSPQQPLLTGPTPGAIQTTPVPTSEAIQTTPVKQEQYSENGIPEEVADNSDVATVKFSEEVSPVTQSSDEGTKVSDLQNTGEVSVLGSKKEGKRKKKGSGSSMSKENSLDSNKENTSSDASSVVDGKEVVVMATDSSGVVVENGGSFLPEDRYIFTDFENQKAKEEEFQTVSSRKKKKQHQNHAKETENVRGVGGNGGGFINGFTSSVFTSSGNGGMENHHRRLSNGAREYVNHFRHRQQGYNNNKYNSQEKRSYTPPPTPTSSVMEDKQPHSRAFSPSAFPALATKGAGSSGGPAGGRRNSTGNAIELEVEEIEKEDSDLESCKSAPASKPVVVEVLHSDGKTAANFHHPPKVSYAKVLGGNQLHDGGDRSHHPQDSPERERRHSLGNLPMPPPGQLDTMKQGVARSQELVNGERTLSSGVSSLSSSSKASSLANSKYSSTENLATATSNATTTAAGGGPREYPPPQNEVTATITINPSSDADFPPICFTSATSSSAHLEFSNVHVAKNISLTDSQRNNKWSQPPPLVNTSSHSNGNNYSSSSNNGSSSGNNVVKQQQGAATSQSEAGSLLQKTTSDTTTSSSLSSSSSTKSKHQTSSLKSSVTPASSHLPSSLTTTTATTVSSSTDQLITKHHVPVGSSDRRKPAPPPTVLQSGSNNVIISGGGGGSSKNVVNKAKTNAAVPAVAQFFSNNNTSSTSKPDSRAQTTRKPVPTVNSTSAAAKATTSKTTRKNKSVIFLDRKFHEKEETNKFEISFGFDSDSDMAEVDDASARSIDDPIEEDRCNSSTSSSNSSSVAADNTSVQANHVIVTNPSQKLQLHPLPCLVPSQPPPNGLVMMPPISLNAVPTGIRPLVTDQQGVSIKEETSTGGGKQPLVVVVDTKTPVTTTMRDETVVVAEELSDKLSDTASEGWQQQEVVDFPSSSGGGGAPYVLPKLPSRDEDPNYQRGKFDLEKAVSYIYTEWCHVMQEGDKVRDSVAVYGRDLS